MTSPPYSLPGAPLLVRPPAVWLVVSVLVLGVGARERHAEASAAAARIVAADSVARETGARHIRDSLTLVDRIAASSSLTKSEVLTLDHDVEVFSGSFEHTNLHGQAVTIRLDSAQRLLRAGGKVPEEVQRLLDATRDPIPPAQQKRMARMQTELARVVARRAAKAQAQRRQ